MNMYLLLDEAEKLLGDARFSFESQYFIKSERCLVELLELLNSQPELKAGGCTRKVNGAERQKLRNHGINY